MNGKMLEKLPDCRLTKVESFASIEFIPDEFSLATMVRIGCAWSHAGKILTFEDGQEILFHSTDPGVNLMEVKEFLETHAFVHRVDTTKLLKKSEEEIRAYIAKKLKIPYSHKIQFLGFMPLIGPLFRKMLNDGDKTFKCSELAADFDETLCEIDLWDDLDFVCPRGYIEELLKYIKEIR